MPRWDEQYERSQRAIITIKQSLSEKKALSRAETIHFIMQREKILSIVTPTRGNFTDQWAKHLCEVNGDIELILVYPPGTTIPAIPDPRVKPIISPFKGELIQRLTGLMNASGRYVLALDDDDYLHPDVLPLVITYFEQFPESWCLRLKVKKIDFKNEDEITKPWGDIPHLAELPIEQRVDHRKQHLVEVPIAPLKNCFDIRFLCGPYVKRKDMHGTHIENFNNKVWKTELVQQTLSDISNAMIINNALTWIPKWSLDRLLGLFIQARFFEENKVVGHWMPFPEQIRYVSAPQESKNEFRLMLPADALLARRFPQYGYFWNLFFEQFWVAIKKLGRKWIGRKA